MLVAGAGASGCGLVLGLGDGVGYSDAADDGGSPDGPPVDASTRDAEDAADAADADTADAARPDAPDAPDAERGPRCVPIPNAFGPAFCIDETEVTNAQYLAMMKEIRSDGGTPLATLNSYLAGTQCPALASLSDLDPTGPIPKLTELPVVNVGWCQAIVFCKWAGKHMCGAVGGAPVDVSTRAQFSATSDEWQIACSNQGSQSLPYGQAGACGVCNSNSDCDAGLDAAAQVRSFGSCVSDGGVYDLIGNVQEWENGYAFDAAVANRYASVRGGAFTQGHTTDCAFDHGTDWASALKGDVFTGIRCCR